MQVDNAVAEFRRNGMTVIEDALSPAQVATLTRALDELTGSEPRKIHNVADILWRHDAFLDVIDLPKVLPVVRVLLGDNIWVNHTHYNVNPPESPGNGAMPRDGYGWHRDGGVINEDIPKPAPLLSIKVAFYLSDLSVPGRGQTYVIKGSHETGEAQPARDEMPENAVPICVSPGSALLFDRRMIHSIRSRNDSDITRKALFIQYAYRWLCAVDAMTVDGLADRCDPVKKQLLGLLPEYNVIDGAVGRSSRYYPRPHDLAIAGNKPPGVAGRIVKSLRRRVTQLAKPR